MSIMGMREWFHKNRVAMIVVGALLLLGLLVSYGRFGASSGVSTADYEKAVENARAAYAEDSTNPANVQALAAVLAEYASFLNKSDTDYDTVNAIDQEALKYYDEYFGLMVLESTNTYNETPNYANAYTVASYISQRANVQNNIENRDGTPLTTESNKWFAIAMNHRVDELNAELAENPGTSSVLSDLADATAAVAYYTHANNSDFDLTPAYTEAIGLLQQAVDNADDDAKAETLAGYYRNMGSYAYNIDKTAAAEGYYKQAVEVAPADYNSNVSLASFYLSEQNYDEAVNILQTYHDSLAADDENRESLEQSIEYIIGLRDAGNSTDTEADGEDVDSDSNGEAESENGNENNSDNEQ